MTTVTVKRKEVVDVTLPDGGTMTMEVVDRWPGGLMQLRRVTDGAVLILAGTDGMKRLFNELVGVAATEEMAVISAAPAIAERIGWKG